MRMSLRAMDIYAVVVGLLMINDQEVENTTNTIETGCRKIAPR